MLSVLNSNVCDQVENLASLYQRATPFSHIIIDNFLDEYLAEKLLEDFPDKSVTVRSGHRLFVHKYELAFNRQLSYPFQKLHQELTSTSFNLFLSQIVGENVFVDPERFADIHLSINGSFLDIHTDFNIHCSKLNWLHCLNVIIYLNKEWQEEFGGQLILTSKREELTTKIEPLFNRCVIMKSDDTTYHGCQRLVVPENITRKSIIIPVYKEESIQNLPPRHLTQFFPQQGFGKKLFLSKIYNSFTSLKLRWKKYLTKV
ncbi:2OG-Fe(II) oxygenase [Nostoc sp. FACHB-280]|uniref:2OG-Fe(II) oxygenase n=1 Tax=Nostoc sp. FACHB-280 TaxID=2692839 RepID=UPI00168BEE56|nr:2OG-Fe(II) oxygenase [Nostoc sp. FACHB-280]MBD2495101.1 2OG-Fe(II) oxygenase [Nostoc sp. FACHB-280]